MACIFPIKKNSRVIMDLSTLVNQLTVKHQSLDTVVQETKIKIQKQDENMKKNQQDQKEMKRYQEKNKEEIDELKRIQEDSWDSLAILQMKQREMVLCLRGIKESQDEDTSTKLIKATADWLGVQEQEMILDIEKIFRIRVSKAKARKGPGDCLIFLNLRLLRDKLLLKGRSDPLCIEGSYVEFMREIPTRLLKRRENYRFMTSALKKNKIRFKWEFPEGLSFTYKDRRRSFRSGYLTAGCSANGFARILNPWIILQGVLGGCGALAAPPFLSQNLDSSLRVKSLLRSLRDRPEAQEEV
ncbi:uncharacterized protein LOC144326318 [Podarcis muralis]